MTKEESHSGGCQCGAVRYRITGAVGYPHVCHCRMCQKASGNYALPLGGALRGQFALTRGEPAWFHSSDAVRRGFCPSCGTPLFYDAVDAEWINVTLGSLDAPDRVEPVAQSSLASKLSFSHRLDDLPHEPEETAREWLVKIALSQHQHPDHDTAAWPPEEDRP